MWSEVAYYTQDLKKVLLPICLNVNREVRYFPIYVEPIHSTSDTFRTRSKHVHCSAVYAKQFNTRLLNSIYKCAMCFVLI